MRAEDVKIPRFRFQTMNHPLRHLIKEAEDKEMSEHEAQGTFEGPIDPKQIPKGTKIIGTQWVYRAKPDMFGFLASIKARLALRGDQEKTHVAKYDAYAPVMDFTTLRLMLAMHIGEPDIKWYQLDVTGAYLSAYMRRPVYVYMADGYRKPGREYDVYRVVKALYGGIDSGRCFYDEWVEYHLEMGFQTIHSDKCYLQLFWRNGAFIKMCFHVDDGAYCVKSDAIWEWYLAKLDQKYRYRKGELSHFLNVRFTFSHDYKQVKLDQEQQIHKLVSILPGNWINAKQLTPL